MKIGVFSPVLKSLTLAQALAYLEKLGVDCLELGCGGYPGKAHADAQLLLTDKAKLKELKSVLSGSGVKLSALSCHGNCVHPDKAAAAAFQADFDAALALAGELGIDRVVTFSGCPGDGKGDSPNWVTCAWPPEFAAVLSYQWNDVLIPYWQQQTARAKACGVNKIALEMHPGFCVYNPETLLRLRAAVGPVIGANLDPSHLIWQGIDVPSAVAYLKDAIYFFHAKDTALNPLKTAHSGVLDNTPYSDLGSRAWNFRTVGYGLGESEWKKIISALRLYGYDDVLSIEHEDAFMSDTEGLAKAVEFLQKIAIRTQPTEMFWA